jgi:sugar (pentulose or hexulose) kinase
MLTKRLPSVVPPGTVTEKISRSRAAELGLPAELAIVAGTTDGCAAFLATGATKVGEAVTSLGTTLILKLLSKRPLFAPEFGVYSHRIDDVWLTGGASNSGGAAIERHFTLEQIKALSKDISPNVPTSLDYYPLPGCGERFPLNQPDLDPQLEPRPADDVVFLQALMEGIAGIEKRGYVLLNQLGGPALASVRTVGGGAKSRAWIEIRSRVLGVPFIVAEHDQPAVGSAKLAWRALRLPSDDLATR